MASNSIHGKSPFGPLSPSVDELKLESLPLDFFRPDSKHEDLHGESSATGGETFEVAKCNCLAKVHLNAQENILLCRALRTSTVYRVPSVDELSVDST